MKALSKLEEALVCRGPMSASMDDVARLANVSLSTVSRVLNRRNVVHARTRERVESAIQTLGYRPNAFARGLMLRRSEILGLVLPDLHGEFYSEIIRGANYRARELGYNLIISSARDGDDSRSLLDAVGQRTLLDGVAVMVSEVTDRIEQALSGLSVPYVLLDDDIDGTPHDCVIIDQHHGALALMRHLVYRCDARRVLFVGGLKTNFDTGARREAYWKILSDADLSPAESDIYHLDYTYETAYELASSRMREWVGRGHYVFAANDEMAAGIVAAAVACGLSVPKDIGVVGFDDTRVARLTRPQLTTVRVPMSEMGAKAIELLCQRIADPTRPATRIPLRPELIVRESCGSSSRS